MAMTITACAHDKLAGPKHRLHGLWPSTRERFLAAVAPEQRAAVEALLGQPRHGGLGLRMWLRALTGQAANLPGTVPPELIRVYLTDPEAVPLHDCGNCGLAIPVRPSREDDFAEPERVYFAACPACGGRTGWYAYLSSKLCALV